MVVWQSVGVIQFPLFDKWGHEDGDLFVGLVFVLLTFCCCWTPFCFVGPSCLGCTIIASFLLTCAAFLSCFSLGCALFCCSLGYQIGQVQCTRGAKTTRAGTDTDTQHGGENRQACNWRRQTVTQIELVLHPQTRAMFCDARTKDEVETKKKERSKQRPALLTPKATR